jgi:chromosome segregation ATPase
LTKPMTEDYKPMRELTRKHWDYWHKWRVDNDVHDKTRELVESESYYKQRTEVLEQKYDMSAKQIERLLKRNEQLERYFKNVTKTSEAVKELIVQRETRIEQLEQENERLEKFIINLQDIGFVTEQRLKAEVEQLEQQLKEAKVALEFYADSDNYKRPFVRHGDGENIRQDSNVQNDEGIQASSFLQQLKDNI